MNEVVESPPDETSELSSSQFSVENGPYPIGDNYDTDYRTYLYILCAANITSQPNAADDAWKRALHRFSNTSNAKDEMAIVHGSHPVGKAELVERAKRARRQIDAAHSKTRSPPPPQRAGAVSHEALPRQQTQQRLWSPTHKELAVYIACWLMTDGLPYNTVTTKNFRLLIQRTTGNPDATIIAAKNNCIMLKVSLSRFCVMVKHLLEEGFVFAHRFPFLIPLHDLCTIGSHHSTKVKTLITSRVADLYGLTIACMAQFLVSDTTPNTRKISKLFYDAVQLDCTMHVLNFCLVYGLGMRENVYIVDTETNIPVKQRRVCTPGAPFQKVRPWSRKCVV
ncbi:hypothetical protein PI125_g17661 [Phytophthora idaei]|nr:hypothetical protein PI125_g17661 [Phytophthora idaei]